MTSPWWAAFGPAQTALDCGAGRHRLCWSDGTLVPVDHPDAEGELVLAALGGDATPCLDLVRLWGQHSDDLTVFSIGPRSADDKLTITSGTLDELPARQHGSGLFSVGRGWTGPGSFSMSQHSVRRLRSRKVSSSMHVGSRVGFGFAGPIRRPLRASRTSLMSGLGADGSETRIELMRLLALGTAFQFRLAGAVAHAWSAGGQHAGHRGRAGPALAAALTGRVAPVAAQWLGIDPDNIEVSIHDESGWGSIELNRSAAAHRLHAQLPVSWLATVWAPGLAVVGSHLVVAVRHARWPAAEVLAVPAPGKQPVELAVRHDGQGWQVAA